MEKLGIHSLDKGCIVIDIGSAYTKIGFIGENYPRKIVKTSLSIFHHFKQFHPSSRYSLYNCLEDKKKLKADLEIFLTQLIFNELMVKIQGKNVYLCENYYINRVFIETVAHILFTKFEV